MSDLDPMNVRARFRDRPRRTKSRPARVALRPRFERLEDRLALSSTTLSITPAGGTATYGTMLTLTADVTGDTIRAGVEGSVSFYDGSVLLGTSNYNTTNADFELTTQTVAAGTQSRSGPHGSYTGRGGTTLPSTSPTVSETIAQAPLTVTVGAARVVDGPDSTLTASYSGFVAGQATSWLSGEPMVRIGDDSHEHPKRRSHGQRPDRYTGRGGDMRTAGTWSWRATTIDPGSCRPHPGSGRAACRRRPRP